MKFRYRKGQIIGKKLKVPKYILNKVYNCTLSFEEFINNQLDDKIPISCLDEQDRMIVEKFGIDRCKELDWELINKSLYYEDTKLRDRLMEIDPQTEDINHVLYEMVKDIIRPSDYSQRMALAYPDRLFEIPEIDRNSETYSRAEERIISMKNDFNYGEVSLRLIAYNWDLFKDKDLSFCLLNDKANTNNITDGLLRELMDNYGVLLPLIEKDTDIYTFLNTVSSFSSEEEKHNYVRQLTDGILNNISEGMVTLEPTNEQYSEIFKYSSLVEHLRKSNYGYLSKTLIQELEELPEDYLYNMPIPVSKLFNRHVLSFIEEYGLRNVVDFDNECGQFFTANDCEMLGLMYDMYLHYGSNEHDLSKSIYTRKSIEKPYTKDEFYEAMRRMIVYGPSDGNYVDKAPDYRNMTGEFRVRNSNLFIPLEAPEELQELFYTKSLTPEILVEHPEYAMYLEGKNLSSCFKRREVRVSSNGSVYEYENMYDFLSSKMSFNDVMNFIIEYSDVLYTVFDDRRKILIKLKRILILVMT